MPTRKKAKGKTKVKRRKTLAAKATTRRKTATRKKKGEEDTGPALITQESHADRERRGQIETGQTASTADTQHARATRSAGGAYRCRDPLLQSPVSRDPTDRVRYAARWRRNPHPRTHHRFQPEG